MLRQIKTIATRSADGLLGDLLGGLALMVLLLGGLYLPVY